MRSSGRSAGPGRTRAEREAASTSSTASTSGNGTGGATRSRPRRGGRHRRAGATVRTAAARGAHHDHADHRYAEPLGTRLAGEPRPLLPEWPRLRAPRLRHHPLHLQPLQVLHRPRRARGGRAASRHAAPHQGSGVRAVRYRLETGNRLASTAATGAGWRPSPGANAQPSAPRAASRRRRPSGWWPRLPTGGSPSGAPPDSPVGGARPGRRPRARGHGRVHRADRGHAPPHPPLSRGRGGLRIRRARQAVSASRRR